MPNAARRMAAYQAQRAAFIQPERGTLPPQLERRNRRPAPWRVAAAIMLVLAAGGTGGWFLHQPSALSRNTLALQLLELSDKLRHPNYGQGTGAAADRPLKTADSEKQVPV